MIVVITIIFSISIATLKIFTTIENTEIEQYQVFSKRWLSLERKYGAH